MIAVLVSSVSADASLVAQYHFDGDLKDATGSHDGHPVDPQRSPVFATGRCGNAVVIEEPNAGIEAAHPDSVDFSKDFTIAAWVNVGCYYAELPILFKGHPDQTVAPDKHFGLFGNDGVNIAGAGQGEWITNFRDSNGIVPNDGQWHHVAVTYRATETPHFSLYVDGQGKTPTERGNFRGGDFKMLPDAAGSVLRFGCRGDGDTWRYVRSHLRGLLDELQIYDHAVMPDGIRFLYEHPGSVDGNRSVVCVKPTLEIDKGHDWRPPFGLERVGPLRVIVQFGSEQNPAPEHWLVAYRDGREVERKRLIPSGASPFTVQMDFSSSPSPDEVALIANDTAGKPVEKGRWPVRRAEFEADAESHAEPVMNPVDLGAIFPPVNWLVLGPKQEGVVEVAAISGKEDILGAQVVGWFESGPEKKTKAPIELRKGVRAGGRVVLPKPTFGSDHDVVHVGIVDGNGRELWHKKIDAMLIGETPQWPDFGATETRLRYDLPILVYSGPDSYSKLPYEKGWDPARKDVVVSLPNGSRFVFWRGAAYTPFWAGRHNTALNYEFAEATPRKDGRDCVDASSDRELRYGRVEIIESSAARVHVRWSTQPCDLDYKVWGESVVEDFYFYPDGFGSRTMTLTSDVKAEYELEELLLLTPPGARPLRVFSENLVDVLFRDGRCHKLEFPILGQERDYQKLLPGEMPPLFRIRLHRNEPMSAVYFNPGWTGMPVHAYRPFYSEGQLVAPFYWGNHLPLTRMKPTGHNIDQQRADETLAHNAMMTWGHHRPKPIESRVAEMPDALGVTRPMQVEKWAWLIGMSDSDDVRLLEWGRSFATPPQVEAKGATLQFPAYNSERRATLLTVDKPIVSLTIKPATPCVHPVFELHHAAKGLTRIELNGRALASHEYAWDGHTLWLNRTLSSEASLTLVFSE